MINVMAARFDPTSFLGVSDHVALNVAGSELFSLISRTYDLPASWAAMVTREGGAQSVVSAGAEIDGGDADSVLFHQHRSWCPR